MTIVADDLAETMRRFWEAESAYVVAGRQDFSGIAKLLHQECVMHAAASFPYGGTWRGHDGFERWTKAFADFWSRLEVSSPIFHQASYDTLFIRSRASGTIRATGVNVEWPLLQQVRFKDGVICEIWPFYWDTAAILTAS